MKNVLITGGSGFIGSYLSLELIAKGYNVTVLDNMSEQIHGKDYTKSELYNKIKDKVNFIHGTVTSKSDWIKALEGVQVVVHLAAETGTGQSMYEIDKYVDVNISGTTHLLDIMTNHSHTIEKVVVASSRAIYGEGKYICSEHGAVYPLTREERYLSTGDFEVKCPSCDKNVELVATTEDSKVHPTSIYGFTKQAQEDMLMIVGKSVNIPVVAYRYQNVYGPGQSLKNPYTGILSIFSTRIKNGNDINIFEDGEESRDFVFIHDVVDATIRGIENDNANFKSYNVGTGKAVSVIEVAETLKKRYESDVNISISGNYRLGDIRHNFADIDSIQRDLGFQPQYDFQKGIQLFTEWVNAQPVEEDNYEQSIEEMKQKGLYK